MKEEANASKMSSVPVVQKTPLNKLRTIVKLNDRMSVGKSFVDNEYRRDSVCKGKVKSFYMLPKGFEQEDNLESRIRNANKQAKKTTSIKRKMSNTMVRSNSGKSKERLFHVRLQRNEDEIYLLDSFLLKGEEAVVSGLDTFEIISRSVSNKVSES